MKTYDDKDQLPADYKAALIDLLSFQADSEFAGAQRVGENMRFAPRPEEAYRLSKKYMEEVGHGWYCWNILAPLGVDVNARVQHLVQNPDNPDPKKVRVINGFRKENWSAFFEYVGRRRYVFVSRHPCSSGFSWSISPLFLPGAG